MGFNFKNALGGAAAGFMVGGPWGALAGGGLGGFLGGSGSPNSRANELLDNEFRQVEGLGSFQAPQLGALRKQLGAYGGPQSQAFNQAQQMALMDSQGQGPGQDLVRQQVGEQTNQGVANQLAQQAGLGGAAGVLGARSQGANFANIAGQGQRAASQGGLQAMMQGRQQLGALSQADMQNQLQTQQLRQSGMLGAAGLQQQGALARQQQLGQRFANIAGQAGGVGGLATQQEALMGGAMGLAGSYLQGRGKV